MLNDGLLNLSRAYEPKTCQADYVHIQNKVMPK